jgi:hypothetical protein
VKKRNVKVIAQTTIEWMKSNNEERDGEVNERDGEVNEGKVK